MKIRHLQLAAATLLLSKACLSLTLPSHAPALLLSTNSSSSLSLAAPPKGFDYHISIYRLETAMNETAAYMTLLAAMSELAFKNQQLSLDTGRIWSLPAYDVCVVVKSREVRFAVWGLLYIFDTLYSSASQLRPMIVDMAWEGGYVGEVHITADCLESGMLVADGSAGVGNARMNMTMAAVGAGAGVQYILTPNGGPVTIGDVFRVALSVLANSAAIGVERPFVRTADADLGFRFAAALDGNGVSLMTEADLMRMVVFVARKMVGDGSFREVGIQMLKNGRMVGEGQLSVPLKAASQ